MKQNRSSLRSINMLKTSFIEILKEKDINKITVREVTELANLTRNTFYAHFVDIYDLNDSIEDEIIEKTIKFIDESKYDDLFDNTLAFFKNELNYINRNKELFRAFLEHGTTAEFIDKYSRRIIDHVIYNISAIKVSKRESFRTFLDILFTGSVFLIKQYLEGKSTRTIDEIATSLSEIFVNSYHLYI